MGFLPHGSGANPRPPHEREIPRILEATLGALAGGRLGVFLAAKHPAVKLAEDINRRNLGETPKDNLPLIALRINRGDEGQVLLRAEKIRRQMKAGAATGGAILLFLLGMKLILLTVRPPRRDYEADPAACVACGRCYEYCPREQARLKIVPFDN